MDESVDCMLDSRWRDGAKDVEDRCARLAQSGFHQVGSGRRIDERGELFRMPENEWRQASLGGDCVISVAESEQVAAVLDDMPDVIGVREPTGRIFGMGEAGELAQDHLHAAHEAEVPAGVSHDPVGLQGTKEMRRGEGRQHFLDGPVAFPHLLVGLRVTEGPAGQDRSP